MDQNPRSLGSHHEHDAEKLANPYAPSSSSSTPSLVALDRKQEKALLRKLDLRLLPGLTFLYLLSFLDRSNVANARIEGLVRSSFNKGFEQFR